MKHRLKKMLCVVGGMAALAGGESFATGFQDLPLDLHFEIVQYLSLKDTVRLGGISRSGRTSVQERLRSSFLDLSEVDLDENQFRRFFQEGGLFHKAGNILLSTRSYRGNWIQYLPTENLGPKEDGSARFKFRATKSEFFEYLGVDAHLGHAWKDPNGLMRFDAARDENGHALTVTRQTAIEYCEQRGARVHSHMEYSVNSKMPFGEEWINAHYIPKTFTEPDLPMGSFLDAFGSLFIVNFINSGISRIENYYYPEDRLGTIYCVRDADR